MNGGALVGAAKVTVDGRTVGVEQTRHVKLYCRSLAPLFGQTPALEVTHADPLRGRCCGSLPYEPTEAGRRGHVVYGRGE
jgi:hypothetical protein